MVFLRVRSDNFFVKVVLNDTYIATKLVIKIKQNKLTKNRRLFVSAN